jgi:hypothetical protein
MPAAPIPSEVAVMATRHIGIIARHSAIWDGVVGDLIVKGPTGAHEVIVEPAIDTLFVTRTNDPHLVRKRLGRAAEQSQIHPGWLMNFVAAGDTLTSVVPRGNAGMDRLALSITPHAVERLGLGLELPRLDLVSAMNVESPLVREIVNALAREATRPAALDPPGRLTAPCSGNARRE